MIDQKKIKSMTDERLQELYDVLQNLRKCEPCIGVDGNPYLYVLRDFEVEGTLEVMDVDDFKKWSNVLEMVNIEKMIRDDHKKIQGNQ